MAFHYSLLNSNIWCLEEHIASTDEYALEDYYQAFGDLPLPTTRASPWGCSQPHSLPFFPSSSISSPPQSWRIPCTCWVRICEPALLLAWRAPNLTDPRAQDAIYSSYFLCVTFPPLLKKNAHVTITLWILFLCLISQQIALIITYIAYWSF